MAYTFAKITDLVEPQAVTFICGLETSQFTVCVFELMEFLIERKNNFWLSSVNIITCQIPKFHLTWLLDNGNFDPLIVSQNMFA